MVWWKPIFCDFSFWDLFWFLCLIFPIHIFIDVKDYHDKQNLSLEMSIFLCLYGSWNLRTVCIGIAFDWKLLGVRFEYNHYLFCRCIWNLITCLLIQIKKFHLLLNWSFSKFGINAWILTCWCLSLHCVILLWHATIPTKKRKDILIAVYSICSLLFPSSLIHYCFLHC